MCRGFVLLLSVALFAFVPTALADEISGHGVTLQVTDQAKHTAPTDSDVTFIDYQFSFSGDAPQPASGNPADAVGSAFVLLIIDHQVHSGQTLPRNIVEDNVMSYKITFNGLVVQYDATLHMEDSGWNLLKSLDSINPFHRGPSTFGQRGFEEVHYLVYNETGSLVADETEREPIYTLDPWDIADTQIWMSYDSGNNGTFTVTPVFLAHTILPQYLHDAPQQTAGQVKIRNVTYQTLEIQVTAAKTLEDVTLAYGFGRVGTVPSYTLGSLLHDAARTVGELLGGVVSGIVDFVFKFVPHGDKILFVKDFVGTLVTAFWEVFLQDPLVLLEDSFMLAVGYGLLLFIDPIFKHVFTPMWLLVKGLWKLLTLVWGVFLWIVRFIVSKIPTGGG